MIFTHRNYYNIFLVSTISGQEFPILLQYFEKGSIQMMPYSSDGTNSAIFDFSEIEAFFLEVYKTS